MWSVPGKMVDLRRFQPFQPAEVLYEFDGPRIFTLTDAEGELNLAYWSDEDDQLTRYVVVPTTTHLLAALRRGGLSVFDALNQPRCWLCDVTHQGDLTACQRVEFEDVPRDALPAIGTMLLPSLEPLLTLRALGDEIIPGEIPARALEPVPLDLEGRIRALDKDRLSFELREITGTTQCQRFVFDEELLEEVFQAFQDDARVKVAGSTFPVKHLAYALALSRVTATEPGHTQP